MGAVRPKITINIPAAQHHGQHVHFNPAASPYMSTAHSNPSQFSVGGPQWPPNSPYVNAYNPFASGFMFKQYEGFRDFTKSGLNMGERCAFYIYEKFSRLSRKWFTHIFLLTIMFLYSVAGAYIFQSVEGESCLERVLQEVIDFRTISGPAQELAQIDFNNLKREFSESLHGLAQVKELRVVSYYQNHIMSTT